MKYSVYTPPMNPIQEDQEVADYAHVSIQRERRAADPAELVEHVDTTKRLLELVTTGLDRGLLTDRELLIFRMRYFEDQTLAACGKVLGVSVQRVRQIEAHGRRKLLEEAFAQGLVDAPTLIPGAWPRVLWFMRDRDLTLWQARENFKHRA